MFRVGQKVVCIKSGAWHSLNGDEHDGPAYGDVVTIRGFDTSKQGGLLFHEWRRPQHLYSDGTERGYLHIRFRPVVERKTDISIFTKMLTPDTRRVQERA